ncbi:hypothetical protein BZA05DRAFT_451894 [Tricharina praecox]|uniref:uncharacterized protein n=1 Tax=Tricharina praecox TaxID=43433 RepID=UPI002220E5A9|nr:uncharacterized protein BZA05DRAFT_451894 [Tricharina praecox]KAI5853599.1 hypothetical protein BZA05DRAFT_451894 [Tricharina praecox]
MVGGEGVLYVSPLADVLRIPYHPHTPHTTMTSESFHTWPPLSDCFAPSAPLSDEDLAASLLAAEVDYKSKDKKPKKPDGHPRDNLWIWARYEDDKDADTERFKGWSQSGTAWLKEYYYSFSSHAPTVLPSAAVSGEASIPRRIKRLRDRGTIYPHFEVPRTIYSDIEAVNPFVILTGIEGKAYPEQFKGAREQDKGIELPPGKINYGCIGWSFAQKRRFVRSVALMRITLLCLRSKYIRGGGDEDPRVAMPYMHRRQTKGYFQEAGKLSGPWATTKDAIWDLLERFCISQSTLWPADVDNFQERCRIQQDCANAWARPEHNEMDPDYPYVLDHGDLYYGYNIMSCQTRPTGILDFERATYTPYSAAIHDLTNTYPVYRLGDSTQVRYLDYSEWSAAPLARKPFLFPTDSIQAWADHQMDTEQQTASFDEYHAAHPSADLYPPSGSRVWNLQEPGTTADDLARWGKITWEDFASGDFLDSTFSCACDDVACDMAREHPLRRCARVAEFPRVRDHQAKAVLPHAFDDGYILPPLDDDEAARLEEELCNAARVNVCKFWFYPPVLNLVDMFVREYFNDDPLYRIDSRVETRSSLQ